MYKFYVINLFDRYLKVNQLLTNIIIYVIILEGVGMMNIAFKISDFLNLPTIIAFGLGILLGFLLLLLIYLLAVIRGMNTEMRKRKVQEMSVDESEIEWLINEAKSRFLLLEKAKEGSTFANVYQISKDLANDIASKFYPRSKKPLQELTIDETLILLHYITDRVDELLQARILKMFRGMTIKQILALRTTTTKVKESKIYKTAVGAKLGQVWSALRYANPFYWIKKGTIDQAIKIIIKKIALNSIVITGEETYKIYSKKIFEVTKDEDLTLDELDEYIDLEREIVNE
jgi:hypothetical protein